ncbi:unnamed protein product [Cylindrotheca closterium]|uniref:Helicase-associated domain-containing protein n=1 Tax=Cylindrotheca closterium TaxID=2856 RepID=A0AAD2CJ20_9STRA|nr:unnamed protein product [Cylindrotheca closterium]
MNETQIHPSSPLVRMETLHSLCYQNNNNGSPSMAQQQRNHQIPLASYLNHRNHDSNQNHHLSQQNQLPSQPQSQSQSQLQQLQLLQSLQSLQSLLQQPQPQIHQKHPQEFNAQSLFGGQQRTQTQATPTTTPTTTTTMNTLPASWQLHDSLRPILNGLSPSSLAALSPELQSQLLLCLANPSKNSTDLFRALEKQSVLERARALNEMEIRRALEREHQQQLQQQQQQQAFIPTLTSRRLSPSSDENKSDNSQADHHSRAQSSSASAAASLPFSTIGGESVTDLRMVQDSTWESRFKDLVQFKQEHGHCNVPRRYKANPKLGVWVCSIRQQMARGTLNKAKMERLNELDFQWRITVIKGGQINPQIANRNKSSSSDPWMEHFQHLKSIKERTGECSPPVPATTHRKLTKWMDRQRRERNKGRLSKEKQKKLNSIGFQWNVVPDGKRRAPPPPQQQQRDEEGSEAKMISDDDCPSEGSSVRF